jgi:hypothetical protein
MAQPRPRPQLNTFHTSSYPLLGLSSNAADALTPTRDYPVNTTRDAPDSPGDPFACSRSYFYNDKDTEEAFDRQMTINLGPSSSLSSAYRQSLNDSERPLLSTVTRVKRNQRVLGTDTLSVTLQPPAPDGPPSAVSTSPVNSGNSDLWPPRPKKRREKPRIELAPDQPPTTQGKQRARVYVACVQW